MLSLAPTALSDPVVRTSQSVVLLGVVVVVAVVAGALDALPQTFFLPEAVHTEATFLFERIEPTLEHLVP